MRTVSFTVVVAGVLACGAGVSAQEISSAPSPRPYAKLFGKPTPALPVIKLGPRQFELPPSGTRCDIVVVPADPRLDPRMVIEPPDPRRFTLRMVPTERFCRSR